MTLRLSSTYMGDQPEPDWWTPSPSQPIMRGWLGPHRSMSSTPTLTSGLSVILKLWTGCHLITGGEAPGQVGRDGALAHPSLAGQDQHYVPDGRQVLGDHCYVRVGQGRAGGGADRLVRATVACRGLVREYWQHWRSSSST